MPNIMIVTQIDLTDDVHYIVMPASFYKMKAYPHNVLHKPIIIHVNVHHTL